MKRYNHEPVLPPDWMPPLVASAIEMAMPIIGWELGHYIFNHLVWQ